LPSNSDFFIEIVFLWNRLHVSGPKLNDHMTSLA
jgi:hypothetical protein